MTEREALLRAVCENPDDDTPRLVFADWLDEHDEHERAEFIRLQCQSVQSETTRKRAEELHERHREDWLAGLPRFPRMRGDGFLFPDWEFRRGFPEALTAPVKSLLERYDEVVRVPWLRALALCRLSEEPLQDFAGRIWNPQWTELVIQGSTGIKGSFLGGFPDHSAGMQAIVRCPQTAQLRSLWVTGFFLIFEEETRLLASSPHLEKLQQLHLWGDPDSPLFDPLRRRFRKRLVIDGEHPDDKFP